MGGISLVVGSSSIQVRKRNLRYNLWGMQCGASDETILPGCDTASWKRTALHLQDESTAFLRDSGNTLSTESESHPRINEFETSYILEPVLVCRHLTPNFCMKSCNIHLIRRPRGAVPWYHRITRPSETNTLGERNSEPLNVKAAVCRKKIANIRKNIALRWGTVTNFAE